MYIFISLSGYGSLTFVIYSHIFVNYGQKKFQERISTAYSYFAV